MIYEHKCVNDGCEEEIEFEIEPYSSGFFNPNTGGEPPSGGYASTTVDECPKCNTNLDNEAFLEKVYEAWEESREPDEPERDDD